VTANSHLVHSHGSQSAVELVVYHKLLPFHYDKAASMIYKLNCSSTYCMLLGKKVSKMLVC